MRAKITLFSSSLPIEIDIIGFCYRYDSDSSKPYVIFDMGNLFLRYNIREVKGIEIAKV